MTETNFGEIIKRERKRQDLSLAKLSKILDNAIDPSYINRLEKGGEKQANPSFKIVCLLCEALNIDVVEVFEAFGFSSLVEAQKQSDRFTVEELFRSHKIKLPMGLTDEDRNLNKTEQELLVEIITAVFEYMFAKKSDVIEKLKDIIGKIYELREIQHRESKQDFETIEVQHLDITFTIRLDSIIIQELSKSERWKEALEETIDRYGNGLRDFQNGVITLPILNEKWIIQKRSNTLTLLSKQMDVISIY